MIVRSQDENINLSEAVELAQQEERATMSMREKDQKSREISGQNYQRDQPKQMKCYNYGKAGQISKHCNRNTKVRWMQTPSRAEEARKFQNYCYHYDEPGHAEAKCNRTIICEKCQRRGHREKDCRTPKCYRCNKYGHLASQCREKIEKFRGKGTGNETGGMGSSHA
ncbi:CCHC-type zinc finger nucleic acid binding protein-like [Schistocerca americana]|uniref:CCHC-type zinc finger nucleic acid binding protein-like n=1 Tax=Schistocerca americana TaxID=7009 RepID=UPI001F4FAAE9|nr:CCHC-type zinc finger nucleic acid binding protein-like [Schistocerca americana]